MKACPYCAEEIQDAALVCRFCNRGFGAGVPPPITVTVAATAPSRGVAAVLSLFIPGAGQLYCGHVISGLIWLVAVVVGYFLFIIPGLILHFVCILQAADVAAQEAPRGVQFAPVPMSPVAQRVRMMILVGAAIFFGVGGILAILVKLLGGG